MPKRAFAVVAIAAILTTIAVVGAARAVPAIVTSSDLAVAELHTELATRGQLLTGPYSRFAWNHPGPMYFYMLAPFYALSEHRGAALFATAVAINLAAMVMLLWVCWRDEQGPLLVAISIALLIFSWRMPRLLSSPWTAHIPVIASVAFVAICGAIAGGRHRLLPILILFGSFIAQTHLAYVPMVAALSTVALGCALSRARTDGEPLGVVLGLSTSLFVLLWLPTMIEAAANGGGNIAALWRFFVADAGSGQSLGASLTVWGYALSGLLRPDLALPWGGRLVMESGAWTGPVAGMQVAGLALVWCWHYKANRRIEAGMAGCALIGSIVELWAITRIHGEIVDHELIGIVALGAFNLAILSGAAMRLMWMKSARWHEQTAVALSAAAFVGCIAVAVDHFRDFTSYELRRSDTVRIPATFEVLRGFFGERGVQRPHFHLHGDATSDGVAIILRLLKAGWPVTVEEESTSVFPRAFARTGQEDAVVNISAREGIHLGLAARPGNIVLRDRNPLFVDVTVR